MNRLQIGPRLALSYAIIILLTITAGFISLWQIRYIQEQTTLLTTTNERAFTVLSAYNNLLRLQRELESLANQQDVNKFITVTREFNEDFHAEIEEAISALSNTPEIAAQHAAHIEQLRTIQTTLPEKLDEISELARNGAWVQVETFLNNDLADTFNNLALVSSEIKSEVDDERTGIINDIERTRVNIFLTISVVIVLSVIFASLLAFAVMRSISAPLEKLSKAAQNWSKGDFDYQVHIDGHDELAKLSVVFNEGAMRLGKLYEGSEEMVRQRTAELHRYALQLETSVAIAQRVASILDLDALLTEVANVIAAQYGYYYVGVFLLNEQGKYVNVHANAGRYVGTMPRLTIRVGQEGLVGWVAKHRQPALVADTHTDKRFMFWEATPDTRSELAMPLLVGERLLGVLDMQEDKLDGFSPDDIPAFQLLADQIAIAIQNASLYQGEQSQRLLAEKLHQVGRVLTSTLNLRGVLNAILENLHPIVAYDRGSVLLSNGEALEFMAARGYDDNQAQLNSSIPIYTDDKDNVFVKIYHTQEPLAIENVHLYPSWKKVEGLVSPGSWLGIPLIRENEVIGMLSLARMDVAPYTAEEITLATAFGAQAAIALENARLFERSKRFTQQMEYEVQNRTKALQDAYNQLEQLDRTKSSFISIASHELRTPITVLKGYSQILQKDPQLQGNEYYTNMLAGIQSGAERLHSIVDSMLDMAKIDGRTLEIYPEPLDIFNLVQDVFVSLEQEIKERRLSFTITPGLRNLPPIEADHDGVQKVLYHLIVNAIKYTPDTGKIIVNGRSWDSNPPDNDWPSQGIEIMVQDTGIGIDPQYQDLIFNKFYQTGEVALHSTGRTKFKGGGPGLGLAITQGIVTAHRGRLWVESDGYNEESLPGSIFHVVLPLHQQNGRSQSISQSSPEHELSPN